MACQCGDCRIMHDAVLFLPQNLHNCEKIIQESIQSDPQPLFLGLFTRRTWEEHAAYFVFKCRGCQAVQRAFSCYNSHSRFPVVHFHCAYCDFDKNFASFPQTYDESGVPRTSGGYLLVAERMKNPICPRDATSRP